MLVENEQEKYTHKYTKYYIQRPKCFKVYMYINYYYLHKNNSINIIKRNFKTIHGKF